MRGRTKPIRLLGLAACVAVAALFAASPGLAKSIQSRAPRGSTPVGSTLTPGATVSVQGVVQSVSSSTVLVRQLDGSAVIVPIDKTTQFFVNGKSAKFSDVKRGFVLIGSFQAGRPASVLRFMRPS